MREVLVWKDLEEFTTLDYGNFLSLFLKPHSSMHIILTKSTYSKVCIAM